MPEFAGLVCGHHHYHDHDDHDDHDDHRHGHLEAARSADRPAATQNTTDLRRAREHARASIRDLRNLIQRWLRRRGIEIHSRRDAQQANEQLTQLAARHLRRDLLGWLRKRRRTTMGRAARASFQTMNNRFAENVPDRSFAGTPYITHADRDLNTELNAVDAGLLYRDDDSLAHEVANRVARTLRLGFARNETSDELAERVAFVLTDGDADARQESGVSGQTAMSKAELIAHDSVQDAYMTAAHRRYLENGFRYAVYDATIDFKTSDLCRRMDEYVIDLVETPFLVPPNHPWCRSGIRPILDLDGRTPLSEDDIADSYLQTIMATKSYRPKVLDTQRAFRPTFLTDRFTPSRG